MTFLNASLLAAGLACVAIPIVIHLLMHRRRKPVMWGAMRFLVEAYRRQRRRLMVEKWLLLAVRCLILACLAFALGRPLLGALGRGGSQKTVYLLIDNGLAASAQGEDGRTALDRHKAGAKSVLAALGATGAAEDDRVGLIAMGGPAEPVVVPASTDLGAIGSLIDAIEPTDSRTDLPGAIASVASAVAGGPDAEQGAGASAADRTYVVVLSDFLEGSADLSAESGALGSARLPEGVRLLVSAPGPGASNTSIAGLEPLRSVLVLGEEEAAGAGADNVVRVQLRRSGEALSQAQVTTVRARLSDASTTEAPETDGPAAGPAEPEAARAVVRWAPGQEAAVAVLTLPPTRAPAASEGRASGVVLASIDADAVAGDNTWRRPVEFRRALRVGVVAPTRFGAERADRLDAGAWMRLALAPRTDDGQIEVIDVEPAALDAARLAGLDAAVLPRPDLLPEGAWGRLRAFLDAGGLILVTPPPDLNVHLWSDALSRELLGGAEWSLARDTREFDGVRLSLDPAGGGGLLSLVEGELAELLSPVTVYKAVPVEGADAFGDSLLRLPDGAPVLWAGAPGETPGARSAAPSRGLLVYLGIAPDLSWSDMPAKPLMVPLVQEIVRQGIGRARGSWWSTAGTRAPAPGRAVELRPVADARRAEQGETAEPEPVAVTSAGVTAEPLRRSGLWRAVDERGATRGLVAVNPDPNAGRVGPQDRDAVGAWIAAVLPPATDGAATPIVWLPPDAGPAAAGAGGDDIRATVAAMLGESERGSPIDLPLLIAALALAIVEVFLARWASHAEIVPIRVSLPASAEAAA